MPPLDPCTPSGGGGRVPLITKSVWITLISAFIISYPIQIISEIMLVIITSENSLFILCNLRIYQLLYDMKYYPSSHIMTLEKFLVISWYQKKCKLSLCNSCSLSDRPYSGLFVVVRNCVRFFGLLLIIYTNMKNFISW